MSSLHEAPREQNTQVVPLPTHRCAEIDHAELCELGREYGKSSTEAVMVRPCEVGTPVACFQGTTTPNHTLFKQSSKMGLLFFCRNDPDRSGTTTSLNAMWYYPFDQARALSILTRPRRLTQYPPRLGQEISDMEFAFGTPPKGEWVQITPSGDLVVPDNPIVGFIEGDGVGPDIWHAARSVFDAAVNQAGQGRRKVHWWELPAGEKSLKKFGEHLPEETLTALKHVKVAIKGPLTTPVGGGIRSLNVTLRRRLELYACIRPVRYIQGTPSPVRRPQDVDMVLFRENMEDLYAGIEWKSGSEEARKMISLLEDHFAVKLDPESGIGIKPMSPRATKKLVRKAIRFALENGRKRVTLVHKGNIMKFTEGAFRDWGYELARDEFADRVVFEEDLTGDIPAGKILVNDRIADAMFQQVLLRPKEYEVLALPNLNGDYLSDALAAQVGGLGMAPGANVGDRCAVFEATHGSAPKYAGLDKINPGSLILSGAMMFTHMGWKKESDLILRAISDVVASGIVTYDLARQIPGSKEVSCSAFGKAIAQRIREIG